MMCGVVLDAYYEAIMSSYLTTKLLAFPFTSMEELYDNTEFKVVLTPGSSSEDQFKLSKNPLWKKIHKSRIEPYIPDYIEAFPNLIELILDDKESALYYNHLSGM
jgi:hypothetical protein